MILNPCSISYCVTSGNLFDLSKPALSHPTLKKIIILWLDVVVSAYKPSTQEAEAGG
jgi:hypothetical protein